jgi:threonine dehydrogenase-like Zn-dependent dehydrogenase
LQIARAFGASDIIAVDVQDDKLQKAKTLGATHIVNAAKEDAVERIREITGGMGVDVAVEALGKPQTFMQCTLSVKDGGKAVMIGLSQAGSVGEIDINRLVRRKVWGSYSLSLGLVRRKSLVLRLSFKIMILNLFLFCFSNFL